MRLNFAQLLNDHQSMVYSIALRFTRDPACAEELAQDVFLQLYKHLAGFGSERHAIWWLRRSICHRCIDEARKRSVRRHVALESVPEPRDGSVEPDLFLQERLRRLVNTLPEKARMVMVLRYQEDMDPLEIAEMLGMPVSTVKSHLHRSLALLRGRLEKQEVCP